MTTKVTPLRTEREALQHWWPASHREPFLQQSAEWSTHNQWLKALIPIAQITRDLTAIRYSQLVAWMVADLWWGQAGPARNLPLTVIVSVAQRKQANLSQWHQLMELTKRKHGQITRQQQSNQESKLCGILACIIPESLDPTVQWSLPEATTHCAPQFCSMMPQIRLIKSQVDLQRLKVCPPTQHPVAQRKGSKDKGH